MSVRATLEGVSVDLGATPVLRGIDLDVAPGEFLTLLGPSGSGKSTTLNVLAGFVAHHQGSVRFDDVVVDGLAPERRDVGFVFQNYALFPHMTVGDNVAFPLRARRTQRAERFRMIGEALDLVQLGGYAHRPVRTLSGGQQQRVALARALVFEPRLLLLDEPLAALDQGLRQAMQLELRRIHAEVGVTTVAVTHDQTEALTMSDRVAVLNEGRLEQVGPPEELYLRPATVFVATILGEATLVPVHHGMLQAFGCSTATSATGLAVLRPEDLEVTADGAPATIVEIAFQGARHRLAAILDGTTQQVVVAVPSPVADGLRPGGTVHLSCRRPHLVHVIAAKVATEPAPAPVGVTSVDPPGSAAHDQPQAVISRT